MLGYFTAAFRAVDLFRLFRPALKPDTTAAALELFFKYLNQEPERVSLASRNVALRKLPPMPAVVVMIPTVPAFPRTEPHEGSGFLDRLSTFLKT